MGCVKSEKEKKNFSFSYFQSLICYPATAGASIIHQDFWAVLVFSLQKYTDKTFPSQRAVLGVEEHGLVNFPLTHQPVCGCTLVSDSTIVLGDRLEGESVEEERSIWGSCMWGTELERKAFFFFSLQKSWPSYSKYSTDLVMSSFTCENTLWLHSIRPFIPPHIWRKTVSQPIEFQSQTQERSIHHTLGSLWHCHTHVHLPYSVFWQPVSFTKRLLPGAPMDHAIQLQWTPGHFSCTVSSVLHTP